MFKRDQRFGVKLYLRLDGDRLEEYLRKILLDTGGAIAGVKYTSFSAGRKNTIARTRERKLKPDSIAELFNNCLTTDITDVILNLEKKYHDSEAALSFDVTPDHRGLYTVDWTGKLDLYDSDSTLGFLRSFCEAFPVDYGLISVGKGQYVSGIIHLLFGLLIEERERYIEHGAAGNPKFLFLEEIDYYQAKRGEFGKFVPRAEWGNILSPVHIQKLGGEERIRRECDCFLVERWGENLYIQLTESVHDISKKRLKELNKFFEPARFPDAPEPVYVV